MRTLDRLPAEWGTAAAMAVLIGGLCFLATSYLLWLVPYPSPLQDYSAHLQHWLAWRLDAYLPGLHRMALSYQLYLRELPLAIKPEWLTGRFDAALVIGSLCGIGSGLLVGQGVPATRHLTGRQWLEGRQARGHLKAMAKEDCKRSGKGLAMHPSFDWHLSKDRETRHFLLVGSTGGGKTVIIIALVNAAIARGDRLVIFDNKGDFTRWLPQGVLFAPWDKRSFAWDIARDCTDKPSAEALASRLIPPGQDPLWHIAARQLLTACLLKLIRERAGAWTWDTLYKLTCLPREELLAIVQVHLPEARHVADAPDKTAQSILVNFGAHMGLIADLAAAWGKAPAKRRFSFVDWLEGRRHQQQVLILQGSGKFAPLARAYLQSIIALMSGHINSPSFPDSRQRRIWFFIDEFPQVGKIEEIGPLLEIGRSKGIRVVLGAQDLEQIKDIYGEHQAKAWHSLIGTQILVRVNASETANFYCKEIIGYRKVQRTLMHQGEAQPTIELDELVVEPADLEMQLGPHAGGVEALVLGYGHVCQTTWPFSNPAPLRRSSILAPWINGGGQPIAPVPGTPSSPSVEPPPSVPSQPAGATTASSPKRSLRLRAGDDRAMAKTVTTIQDAAEPPGSFHPSPGADDA